MSHPLSFLILLSSLLCPTTGQPKELNVGAIFQTGNTDDKIAVEAAIKWVNAQSDILKGTELKLVAKEAKLNDEFVAIREVCKLVESNIVTLIGPTSSNNVKATLPLIAEFHVPAIAPVATDPTLRDYVQAFKYSVRLLPTDKVQAEAIIDFIDLYGKTYLAILAEDTDYGLNGMLQVQALAALRGWRVLCAQHFSATDSNVEVQQQLTQIKNLGTHFVILFTSTKRAAKIFEKAYEMSLTEESWVWIVSDAVTGYPLFPAELKTKQNKAYLEGIIGTQPINSDGDEYKNFKKAIVSESRDTTFSQAYYDAVLVTAYALDAAIKDNPALAAPSGMNCDRVPVKTWNDGPKVFDQMLKVDKPGVRHHLSFNSEGLPKVPAYSYVQLKKSEGWSQIGRWASVPGKAGNATVPDRYQVRSFGKTRLVEIRDYEPSMEGKIMKVVTVLEKPFVQIDGNKGDASKPCRYDHCYDGYAIELLHKLAQELKFTYSIYTTDDYGRYVDDGKGNKRWTGMVKELLKNDGADMAVGAFTVSSQREKVISFTKPFRDLQMAILLGQGTATEYNPFSFLVPFETKLWIYIMLTALAIGIYLAIVDKLSPYGHHGKKVQNESEDEFEEMDINEDGTIDEWERRNWVREKEAMNFHNSIFWSFASFFEQGGEYHPRAWSGRVVAGAWWFGIVIIIATYTANLAAFLTIKTSKETIKEAKDLAAQDKIRYTYNSGTEVETFFIRHSEDPLGKEPYKLMGQKILEWEKDEKDPLLITARTNETVDALVQKEGRLALLTDGVLADYWKGQKCDKVRIVKNRFSHIGYAIGLPVDSIVREELSLAILKFRENGDIDKLDNNWLVQTSLCKEESKVKEGNADSQQVTLASMLGVFYVIYTGFVVAIVVLFFEWIVACIQSVDQDHPRRPKSVREAFADKWYRLKVDFLENWFPFKLRNTNESEKLFAVRRVPPLMASRNASAVSRVGAHEVNDKNGTNAWN